MASTRVYSHAMQTIGQQKAEAGSVGGSVRCVTDVGGPTVRITASMQLPPAKVGFSFWESKKFTMDVAPTNFSAFGFWAYIHNVDIAGGDNDIVLFEIQRAGLRDIGLEVRAHASGHALHLINAVGSSADSEVNALPDDIWFWIEGFYFGSLANIYVNGLAKLLTASSDFQGDTSGDTQGSMHYWGQIEPGTPDPNNSTVYIGPGYFADDSVGFDDLLVPFSGRKFECITYRLGNTGKKCDENDIDGNGDVLNAGALVDTADDNLATSADYIGIAGTVVGATHAYDTGPDDGPAPDFNKWTSVPFGMKYVWITATGRDVGTRTGRYGSHTRGGIGWNTASIVIGRGNQYTEVFGLPNVGVFPDVPSKNEVTAMGWYVDGIAIDLFKAIELYFFVFCLEGDGEGQYLMLSRKVDKRTSLVGDGGGRV